MALKDVKSIEVKPADEDQTVQLWMSFGWELKSNQRIKTQDVQRFTHQDSDGTKHYETTFGVDFIKLTFERDPERKNYAELVELEKLYNTPLPSIPTPPSFDENEPKRMGFGWGILSVVGLLLYIIPGVIIIIWRLASYNKRVAKWKEKKDNYEKKSVKDNEAYNEAVKANSEAKKKRSEALEKARALV